ncbi:hypothetical protein [Lacticaseibacillus saniviri]|uniref:hypothetical protein n=1 Tax=Lacticaseibacillus saniviri TaxID=931533 RepID=UPI003F713F2B
MPSKTVIEAAKKQGIDFKNHMSTMDDTQEKIAGGVERGNKANHTTTSDKTSSTCIKW